MPPRGGGTSRRGRCRSYGKPPRPSRECQREHWRERRCARGAPVSMSPGTGVPGGVAGARRGIAGKRILLVDDDGALRSSLAEQLRLFEEFSTLEAETGAAALDIARTDHVDAVLLDVGLPDMDGREVCRLLRRNGLSAPIIMLTAADSDADAIL